MSLANFLSPKTGLILIRKQIEKELKKEIPEYSILYRTSENDTLHFIIDDKMYPYDSDLLKSSILALAKRSMNKGQEITAVKITINKENDVTAKLFFTENTEQKSVTINI